MLRTPLLLSIYFPEAASWLSEVVIARIIIVIILIVANVTVIVPLVIIIRLFVVRFQPPFLLILTLRTEASLSFSHLVELGIVVLAIVLKYLILLVLQVLVLQLLDDLLLLGPPLAVLQVVHVQLVLQIVYVRVLLDVRAIETLQFSLKAFVFFLELRFDVLNSFEALICAFQFNSTPLDRILEDGLVTPERLDRLLHLFHLARLRIDNVPDALFDVLLLGVLVQVSADRVEELEGFVASRAHFTLRTQHVMQFGSALSNFSCELAGGFKVVELGARVEVHHLRIHLVVVVHLSRFHRFVHHCCNLEHLLDGEALSLVEPLWIQSETGLLSKQGADLLDKLDTVVTLIDIIGDIGFGVVAKREPVQNVGNEGEVRLAEVLHRDVAPVAKSAKYFSEVAELAIRHDLIL